MPGDMARTAKIVFEFHSRAQKLVEVPKTKPKVGHTSSNYARQGLTFSNSFSSPLPAHMSIHIQLTLLSS